MRHCDRCSRDIFFPCARPAPASEAKDVLVSARGTESRRLWFGTSTASLSPLWGDVWALPAAISGGP